MSTTNKSHHGQLLEYAVRSRCISLTDLAFNIKVNRRTVYNWFESPFLKKEIIYRVGMSIHHDFSVEFPQYFTSDDFTAELIRIQNSQLSLVDPGEWRDKYIDLLERYNTLLYTLTQRR
jgi:hypothetical protein